MQLEPMPDGGFQIAADDLGPLLGLPPPQVPELMREGLIGSVFESGEDEDAGRYRVTFRYRDVKLRLTLNADGTVVSRTRISVGAKAQG